MKSFVTIIIILLAVAAAVLLFDFQLKDEGELPNVEASIEGGKLPDAEIRGPDVNVTTEEKKVEYPKLEVQEGETSIELPTDIDINLPEDRKGDPFDRPASE